MSTKKYVSLEKLGLYDEKIKKVITDADAAALKSAQDYADSLATNYDPAGSSASALAEAKSYADGKDAAIQAAQKAADDAAAAASVADGKAVAAQGEVDALESYVGTFTPSEGVDTVVKYIDAKTANVASDATVNALADRVTQAEKDIDAIEADYLKAADKTELEGKITAAQNAADAAQGEVDALEQTHATDKKALEDAIALKADKTALDEVSAVANAAATKEALQAEIDRAKGEEARIEGLVTAETQRATGIESGLRTDVDAIKGDYLKAADKTELSEAIAAEKTRAEKVEESLQTQINTIMDNPDAEDAINSINEFTQYVAEHGEIAEGFRTDINALKEVVPTLETKEDATAKYDEVKAEIAAIPQADWNQNDETAPDYIKNRTHYEDGERIVIAEYSLANLYEGSQGWRYYDLEDGVYESLPPQTELKLEVDGIVYSSSTINNDYSYEHVTINGYADVHVNISSYSSGAKIGFYNLYGKDVSNCTIRLVTDNVTIKQLDEKFIPYTIARTSDLVDVGIRVGTIEGDVDTLEGKVSANEGKVSTLEGEMDAVEGRLDDVEGAVATKAEAQALADAVADLEGVDAGQETRIAALEAKFGEGDGSVEDMIEAAKQAAIDAAAIDAANKDAVVLSEAQKYADAEDAKIEARVDALEAASATHALASDLTALAGRVTTAEGEIDTLQTEMDAVEALADAADKAAKANAQAIALKASQADLEAVSGRVTALETWHSNFLEASEQEINDLFK